MVKTKKKEKLGNHSNSEITNKVQNGETLMIPSLTQCVQHLYHHLSVSITKVEKGRSLHPLLFPH